MPQLGRCSTYHGKNIGDYLKGKKRPFAVRPSFATVTESFARV